MSRVAFVLMMLTAFYHPAWSFDNSDKASLRRGASLFMNYCSGCHSVQALRFARLENDFGFKALGRRPEESILTSLAADDARRWFGQVPPDLSLSARQRGPLWLHAYLTGFYADPAQRFGTNNRVFPRVAMPDVLKAGEFSARDLDRVVNDLVAFLTYTADPSLQVRHTIGWVVLAFLGIFLLLLVQLKRLYWENMVQ